MGLEDRLDSVLRKQLELIQGLNRARDEVLAVRARLQMRIAELGEQERHAREQHEEAVAEGDPQAEALREWPERTRARIDELEASVGELGTAEEMVSMRIRAAERDLDEFRVLQPQLIARVIAARNTGVSREVFDTLNDALNYIDLALASAADVDPNGPLRHDGVRPRPSEG